MARKMQQNELPTVTCVHALEAKCLINFAHMNLLQAEHTILLICATVACWDPVKGVWRGE